jgi:hypothetical protein
MADQANSGSVFCATKKHLCDLFVEAIRQTTKLLNAEMEAVIADRKQLDRYGIAMARALAQCSRAEALYLLHVSEHGCFPANESDLHPRGWRATLLYAHTFFRPIIRDIVSAVS